MTTQAELRHLTRWCSAHRLSWQPARTEDGQLAILLRGVAGRPAWHDMMLVEDEDGVALHDRTGALLADASEIPALLDVLDSGLVTRTPAMTVSMPAWI
jgi:hypothetical protein